jgi:hypothetical protein
MDGKVNDKPKTATRAAKPADEKPAAKPVQEEKAAGVDQNAAIALYAAQMAEKAMEKLNQIQVSAGAGKKKPASEEAVERIYQSKKSRIANEEKVLITIPAGLIGQPERYHSVVDGHHIEVKPGVPKLIPKSHYENLQMMFEQKRKNAQKCAQMERAAINAFSQ